MMNGDKILNMPAGEEMDALIAEKVMNYQRCDYVIGGKEFPNIIKNNWLVPICRPDEWANWSPSTDISAAWEVMEKMKEYSPSVLWCMEEKFWYCNLWYSDDSNDILCEGQGDTVPLAICRAALIAVMERIRWN